MNSLVGYNACEDMSGYPEPTFSIVWPSDMSKAIHTPLSSPLIFYNPVAWCVTDY